MTHKRNLSIPINELFEYNEIVDEITTSAVSVSINSAAEAILNLDTDQLKEILKRDNSFINDEVHPYANLFTLIIFLDKSMQAWDSVKNNDIIEESFKNRSNDNIEYIKINEIIDMLIENGANINIKEPLNGHTPLHMASMHNPLIIKTLLSKGAKVNVENHNGVSPLHFYCSLNGHDHHDDPGIIEAFLNYGADITIKTSIQDLTPTHLSIIGKNNKIASYLIQIEEKKNPDYIKMKIGNGKLSILQFATLCDNLNIIENLSERDDFKSMVVQPDKYGQNIIHYSVIVNNTKIAKIALQQNIDFIKDNNTLTPWHLSAFFGYNKFLQIYFQYGGKKDVLDENYGSLKHYASSNNQVNTLKYLDSVEISDNIIDKYGHSPLYVAALNNHTETIDYFISKPDLEINIKDISGYTIFDLAEFLKNTDLKKKLLIHGAVSGNKEFLFKENDLAYSILTSICSDSIKKFSFLLALSSFVSDGVRKMNLTINDVNFADFFNSNLIQIGIESDMLLYNAICEYTMSPNNYIRESGVNYRLVNREDECIVGGNPEIRISLSNYGIDKFICRDKKTWWEVIRSDAGKIAKYYYQFTPPLSYFFGSVPAVKIAYNFNDVFKYLKSAVYIPITYTCFEGLNYLTKSSIKYSLDYIVNKFNYIISPEQQKVSKIINNHPKELLYMVQLPGICIHNNEELRIFHNESYSKFDQWRLCFKDHPKSQFDIKPFFSVVEDIISFTFVVGAPALILRYHMEIFLPIWNAPDNFNSKTSALYGVVASVIKTLYESYLELPELNYINLEQIFANRYISSHNTEDLYLIQAPARCNEGDKSAQDFKNLFGLGEVKWQVCQIMGKTENETQIVVDEL